MDWGYADPYRDEDGEEKKVVVTILSVLFVCVFACFDKCHSCRCDSGSRHYSKFWNDDYLEKAGIDNDLGIIEQLLSVDG